MSAVAGRPRSGRQPDPQRSLTAAAPPRRGSEPFARRATRRVRPRIGRAAAWILLVSALLAGIVVVNLAALRERMTSDRLDEEIQRVRDDQTALQASLSRRAAVRPIEAAAQRRLGLVAPERTTYVRLPARKAATRKALESDRP